MSGSASARGEEREESSEEESSEEELDLDEAGRTVFGGSRLEYGTRVWDGALTVSSGSGRCVCDALSTYMLIQDCKAASTARAAGSAELSAGMTFWLPSSAEPRTLLESIARRVFDFHTRGATFDPERSGAEWWCLHIGSDDEVGLHWDRDYTMQADQGLLLHPHLATVTYLSAPASAAPTLVLERDSPLFAEEDPSGLIPTAAACWPAIGRHLAFDGKLLHGAPSGLGRAGASQGRRSTFMVNVWLNHVPWGAEPLPAVLARRMADSGAGGTMAFDLGRATMLNPACIEAGDAVPSSVPERLAPRRTARRAAKKAVRARAPEGPPAGRPGSVRTHRWKFGEPGKKLELDLPWPEAAVREVLGCVVLRCDA